MKKSLKYFIVYIFIVYLVYLITNILFFSTGLGFAILGLAFFIFFIIYFTRFLYKISLFESMNKVMRFTVLLVLAILPVYFVFVGFRINSNICVNRLNELGQKVEYYYLKNGKYPETLDEISSPISRFIKSPFLLLPIPKYKYETSSDKQDYSIMVYEDWDGGHMISSKYKKAKWFE